MKNPKVLLFSGGAIKGYSYLGVIKALNEKKLLENVHTIIGTSVGSIVALLLSLELKYTEIEELFNSCNPENFKSFTVTQIFNLYKTYGLESGEKINNYIKGLLESVLNNPFATFEDLYFKNKKKIMITGTCINKKKLEIFSYETTPKMPLYLAIRISISIPIIFSPVRYNGKLYIDGGVLENYPLSVIPSNIESKYILGICIKNDGLSSDTFYNYILNIFVCIENYIYNRSENEMKKIANENTINLYINEMSFLKFKLNSEEKEKLFNIGYNSTKKYIEENV